MPTPNAKKNVFVGSQTSRWYLLVDNFILKHIIRSIVTKAHRQLQNQMFAFTVEELEAFIAVMYAWGVTGRGHLSWHDIWTESWNMSLCKGTTSRNRFCAILRFLCFDIQSNHLQGFGPMNLLYFRKTVTTL